MATEPPVDDRNDIPNPPSGGDRDIAPISIVEEMKTSYLDYAMSVIVSRALPDVRDGLKPVHRRILYACQEARLRRRAGPIASRASIVGDVMGKYHPHGDSAIYDALARMTQDWSMRVPLIDGQGNFGSMDPDPPAADALHRGAAGQGRQLPARRHRQGHGRLPRPTTTRRSASRRSSPRASPTCWSTAPAASRSAWRPTSRRTISAKCSPPAAPISTIRRSPPKG